MSLQKCILFCIKKAGPHAPVIQFTKVLHHPGKVMSLLNINIFEKYLKELCCLSLQPFKSVTEIISSTGKGKQQAKWLYCDMWGSHNLQSYSISLSRIPDYFACADSFPYLRITSVSPMGEKAACLPAGPHLLSAEEWTVLTWK